MLRELPAAVLEYSDSNYTDAVNHDGRHYFNNPITLNYNGVKYILGFGNSDHLTVRREREYIYVVGENRLLGYISMMLINCKEQCVLGECYLSGYDLDNPDNISYNLLEQSLNKQIEILNQYIES